MIVWDADDFGANHVISDMCQSHDCRDQLDKFHIANPNFKATLFTIPGEMTPELLEWCHANKSWIELAVHGFYHRSNYECEKMTYEEMSFYMERFEPMIEMNFVRGFKAPGWQISDGCYEWLYDNGWWVSDQAYNNDRRPKGLPAYINNNGRFSANMIDYYGQHFHTWDCVGNGVYEMENYIMELIGSEKEFKFVSEVISEAYSYDEE